MFFFLALNFPKSVYAATSLFAIMLPVLKNHQSLRFSCQTFSSLQFFRNFKCLVGSAACRLIFFYCVVFCPLSVIVSGRGPTCRPAAWKQCLVHVLTHWVNRSVLPGRWDAGWEAASGATHCHQPGNCSIPQ